MTEAVLELIQPARQATQQRPRVTDRALDRSVPESGDKYKTLTSFLVRYHRVVAAEASGQIESRLSWSRCLERCPAASRP